MRDRNFRKCVAWVMLCVLAGSAAADDKAWKFHVEPALESGIPRVDAATSGTAEALNATVIDLRAESTQPTSMKSYPASVQATIEMSEPGMETYAELKISTSSAESNPILTWHTLLFPKGVSPMSYKGRKEMLPPPDFDKYWERAKKELAAVPLEAKVSRVTDKDTSTGLLFRVELPSVENTRIVGWFYVPRAAFGKDGKAIKKFPAMIIMPGYGAEEPPLDRTKDGFITLSLNPRNHGPSREFWKSPVEHFMYNITDPEHYFYKLAFLDCLRGVQFLFSRPEVDAKRIAAEGGSQGGLFAIAVAALEPRIACVCSNVTAFSDYPDGMILAQTGHHKQLRDALAEAGTSGALMRKSMTYTDGANMASRVHCPVQINMGGQDPVCPYVCGIVTYNRLPSGTQKEFHVVPDAKHEVPQAMRENNSRWYKRWLK